MLQTELTENTHFNIRTELIQNKLIYNNNVSLYLDLLYKTKHMSVLFENL